MRIYDTLQKKYVQFETEQTVKIYICGITPYDSAHLGHIFTFLTYDLLQRRLEDAGRSVQMVRNITDVDEPIYKRANELGIDYRQLAERESRLFNEVMNKLNFRPLFAEPKASEYIEEMASSVAALLQDGIAYTLDNDIYFDTSQDEHFGAFSQYSESLQAALMLERGGNPLFEAKRNPLDFLLWRGVQDASDPAQWSTEVGSGRPGWHIECSVMSQQLLGSTIDLHGGGSDLIFPHHESEIAQNKAAPKDIHIKHWMHVSPMLLAGEKMSKSLGNMVFAKDLLKDYEPAVIRLALMHYHHRIGGEWQPELLLEAQNLLANFEKAALRSDQDSAERLLESVRAALDDDVNTHEVIDALHAFIKQPASPNSDASHAVPTVRYLLGI